MKHHILVKYTSAVNDIQKAELAPEILKLFSHVKEIPGISDVNVYTNCINRDNRYDLMIVIDMEKNALPDYDDCIWHKQWKSDYSHIIEKKAIFDCE